MKLEIVQYIEKFGLSLLEQTFAIKVSRHKKYNNLVHLKYNQLESDFSRIEVKQARGIILDEDNNWSVVAYPYNKFWEFDNPLADIIDWKTAKVFEKVDGLLCYLFWYDNQWHVATSGTPDGGGNVGDFNFTFAELFWKTWNDLNYKLPAHTTLTYIFELCTPYNRVVVPHKTSRIVFHGARKIKNEYYQESYCYDIASLNPSWEAIKSFDLKSWDECIKVSQDLNPMEQEGFVVCDAFFNRIKLKTEQYKRIAKIRDHISINSIIEIIRKGEDLEFLKYYPEFTDLYNDIYNRYLNLILNVRKIYQGIIAALQENYTRKDFAQKAVNTPYKDILFQLFDHKDIRNILINMNIKYLKQLLKL